MRLAIFGLGFVGDALGQLATRLGHSVDGFSRRESMGGGGTLDASDPAGVKGLDELGAADYDCAVVTFPPGQAHPGFWPALEQRARRRVLLSTTGVYQRAPDGGWLEITEETPLVADHPRLPAEHAFAASGGHLVRLAGLFGPTRNPVRWIREGRVGYEDCQANLVHRDDAARALLALAELESPRAVYNLADGQRHTWAEIIDSLVARGALSPLAPRPPKRADGFVSPKRLLADLPGFSFTDFWAMLGSLADEDAP